MSNLQKLIYVGMIGVLSIVVVGLLMLTPTQNSSESRGHRIVVFPLQSSGPDTAHIAAELTSALIRMLEHAPDVDVLLDSDLPAGMRDSSEHHLWPKEQMISMVFEGSVARIDDTVRITVQLVDGPSDSHIWAETYETTSTDVNAIAESLRNQVLALAAR